MSMKGASSSKMPGGSRSRSKVPKSRLRLGLVALLMAQLPALLPGALAWRGPGAAGAGGLGLRAPGLAISSRPWSSGPALAASSFVGASSPGSSRPALRVAPSPAGSLRSSLSSDSVLLAGGGILAKRVLHELHHVQEMPREVVALTNTSRWHQNLTAAGAQPTTVWPSEQFDHVIFTITPNNKHYVQLVRQALERWTGHGSFLLASSVGVYAPSPSPDVAVTEESPLKAVGPEKRRESGVSGTEVLIQAEAEVLRGGGTVARIGGMYNLAPDRTSFFLKGGRLEMRPDRLLPLVGYEDVAGAVVKVMKARGAGTRGQVFNIVDEHRQGCRDVFLTAFASGLVKEVPLEFTTTEGPIGNTYSASKAREVLGWYPETKSFEDYCQRVKTDGRFWTKSPDLDQ